MNSTATATTTTTLPIIPTINGTEKRHFPGAIRHYFIDKNLNRNLLYIINLN
jgi:hypothetical protein